MRRMIIGGRFSSLVTNFAFGIVFLIGLVQTGSAAESKIVVTEHTRASLVSDHDVLPADRSLRLGLHLSLKAGWHTYWVNPGDAGEAPSMTSRIFQKDPSSSSPEQLIAEGKDFLWPVPERLSEGGLMAYAYQGDILLPQKLVFTAPLIEGGIAHIKSHADWLVCATVCVPEEGDFTLDLPLAPVGNKQVNTAISQSKEAALFRHADAALPVPSPFKAELRNTPRIHDALLVLSGSDITLKNIKTAWFLPEKSGIIQQNAPQIFEHSAGQIALHLTPDSTAKPPYWQRSLSGVVVLIDSVGGRQAVQVTASPVNSSSEISSVAPSLKRESVPGIISGVPPEHSWHLSSFWQYLLFAFLGGIILNLMPCVFPVLAMKAFSLVRLGQGKRHQQIASAGFYTLGVMGSFLLLGGLLIALRLIGPAIGLETVGWGFQFQSPYFVVTLCWLLFAMALNLLGVFEITGGSPISRISALDAPRPASENGNHYLGDMLTGLLAVVVATPCTAPFMGVAIAGALSGPALLGLAVFLAMGLGLAAPYLVIALVPGLAARLPRPGAWMEFLKQFLAFPLLATCVWLLWVAGQQRGIDFAALVVGGAVLLGMAAWLYGMAQARKIQGQSSIFYRIGVALCLILACASIIFFQGGTASMQNDESQEEAGRIERFSPERLAALRQNGTPVFVDMTASWCLTCMINDRVALRSKSVQAEFRKKHIVILRGDWTKKDTTITAWLRQHGRDGVPLYIYYPPKGEGKQLPQILTPNLVLKAVGGA